MPCLVRLKTLQSVLQDLQTFEEPKVKLEQYETPPHIAAVALHTIQAQFESIEGKTVLDAGCGPGKLTIAAGMLGADSITAIDIDEDVMEIFQANCEEVELNGIVDVVLGDFVGPPFYRWDKYFDTVIMNPPFGTKHNAGIDMKFLKRGLEVCSDSVYSLHKSSTRSHIKKKVKEWGVEGSVIAELRYDLPSTYKFHKQDSRDIAVDLWRLHHPK